MINLRRDKSPEGVLKGIIGIVAEKLKIPTERREDKGDKDSKLVKDLNEDSRLVEDLGADSLAIVDIAAEVEDAYGLLIPDDRIMEMHTIGDLKKYVIAYRETHKKPI
jgi:acyl carrier protein